MKTMITEQMLALHADMHVEGDQIRDLLAADVPQHTVLNLYPLDADMWSEGLIQRFQSEAARERYLSNLNVHFMALTPASKSARRINFIAQMSAEHGNATHAIYLPMAESEAATRLAHVIAAEQTELREKVQTRLRAIYARMVIAQKWAELTELHPYEAQYVQVQHGVRWLLSL
jgi:hypothetical protein